MSNKWSNHSKRISVDISMSRGPSPLASYKFTQACYSFTSVSEVALGNLWQSCFFLTLPWLPWGKTGTVQCDITLPAFPVSLSCPALPRLLPLWTVHTESVIFFSLPWFSVQWILSTQATIDLVIGYNPPSAPHPNDPSGTSVPGMGGKLTFLMTQGESAKAHRVF